MQKNQTNGKENLIFKSLKEKISGFIYLFIIILVAALILIPTLGLREIYYSTEAAYVISTRDMIDNNLWLLPGSLFCSGLVARGKPPYHNWIIMISYAIFGYNEFALRFPFTIHQIINASLIYLIGPPSKK